MVKKSMPSILIVDDEQVHRFMLSSMLKEWGWHCVEADDGTTAVAAVERKDYDAVLMDIRMVKMDGREAFRRIHELKPSLPVVLMTAYSSVDDAVGMIRGGDGAQDDDHRRFPRDGGTPGDDHLCGADRGHGAGPRRVRHRQGAGG